MKRIGLALGGGGAKGLAHVLMLKVFDELQIKPHRIAGTSIGAIVGALYASGLTAEEIEDHVREMIITKGSSFREALENRRALKAIKLFDVNFGAGALLKGDRFIEFLYEIIGVSTFEELEIPLRVVATDFWASRQVVLESGELLRAVKASMALPGVFMPEIKNDRVLIDGGGVNPVPYDLLEDCDVTVAIDVMGELEDRGAEPPSLFRAICATFDIMQRSIITEKFKHDPPDIYIKPKISSVNILDFFKLEDVYQQARPAYERLRREISALLESSPK